jgi:hypothetical protein
MYSSELKLHILVLRVLKVL